MLNRFGGEPFLIAVCFFDPRVKPVVVTDARRNTQKVQFTFKTEMINILKEFRLEIILSLKKIKPLDGKMFSFKNSIFNNVQ